MKYQLFFSLLFGMLFSISSSAQVALQVLSPKSMQKDLKVLIETIEGHPDPYTKISEEELQAIIDEVEKNISVELDVIDCYKNFSRIISAIKDGHTSLSMRDYWLRNILKVHGVFPYDVFLTNNEELFVIKSYGDTKIPLGSKILEINGMPVAEFIERVSPYLAYEIKSFRNDRISESFEFLLYLIFKQADQVSFKLLGFDSEVVISTMDFKEWKSQRKDLRAEREEKIAKGRPYDFEILKPGIAKISIFSFAVPSFDKYDLFLIDTFKKIKQNEVHSLIIDVRGNYGGYPKVSSELFHYIHNGYFKTMAQTRMKVSFPYRKSFTDKYPQLLHNNIDFGFKERHHIDLEALMNDKLNTYKDEAVLYNESPIEEKFEFTGDTYLLIDRKSYSASSSFASTFQCYSMGTIIGEPTGGTKIFRANAFKRILPKSKFNLLMSSTKMNTACYFEEDEPVLPNIEAAPTILDVVHDSDAILNFTLRVISKVQKSRQEEDK